MKSIEYPTIEEMEKHIKFDIEVNEKTGEAYLYKGVCQIGGCGLDEQVFNTYEEALKQAYKWTLEGRKTYRRACRTCLEELDMV